MSQKNQSRKMTGQEASCLRWPPKLLLLFLFFTLTLCVKNAKSESLLPQAELRTPKDMSITVEIADTALTRQYGLMNREHLADDAGMLFVFPAPRVVSFWMKDTPLDLSIAYIDHLGFVKKLADMTAFSTKSISSDYPILYALEMKKGSFENFGIQLGSKIKIPSHIVAKQ